MKIGDICTVCETRIDDAEIDVCETCGRELHEPCEEYRTTFDCRHCADETAIGAVEF